MQESQVNVITPLIADCEPPVVVQPGVGAFHYPAVPAQSLLALHSLACYAALDTPCAKSLATPGNVVSLVSVPLVRTLAWTTRLTLWTFDRLNAVHHILKYLRVVGVGTRE